MDLIVAQGRTIRLPAEFFAGDIPADPAGPRVYVLDPNNQPVVVKAVPDRVAPGIYHLDFNVAPNAPLGIWTVRWTAELDGRDVSGEDSFEVTPGPYTRTAPTKEAVRAVPFPAGTAKPATRAPAPSKKSGGRKPAASKRRDSKVPAAETSVVDAPSDSGAEPKRAASRRNKFLAAALFVCLLAVAFAASRAGRGEPTTIERSFLLADQAIREGALDQARAHYLDIVLADPKNKTAFFDLGMLAHFQNRGEEAQDYYLRSLKFDPNYLPALYNLAVLKDVLGRTDEAVLIYRKILKNSPENAATHFNYGLILYNKKGDPEEGRRQIEEAVRLDPTLAPRAAEAFKDVAPTPSPAP